MKKKSFVRAVVFSICSLVLVLPARLAAQSTGRIEFAARVVPTGGDPEPVRHLTFYLLRKSVEDIRKEAAQTATLTSLDQFIDSLGATPELKAWMHKHHSVLLAGEPFTKSLTPEDIVGIPEFFKAYMNHNEAFRGLGFPEPKYTEKEKKTNPEKYKELRENYEAAIRKYIAGAPDRVKGMDLELVDLNPSPAWESLERKERQMIETRAFQLAETRYLVARTDTDLDGQGSFSGIAPGHYWIGLFGAQAMSGDVRVRWDFPVTVRQGETASVELSNLNAAPASASAQNSTN
jgi:hypothetical protein